MEYNWPLYQNSTTTGSSSSSNVGRVRGHNGHFSNPPAAAWETTPPSDYNINHPSFGYPDPNLTVLKLGKRHYDPPVTPPPGPSRINGNPRCQVDGCDSVLQTAKEYHRRHKVCEVHAKAPIVLLLGIEQRFCQQCSRFHALTEFDDSKRSCRRRLAGHNQRRRKTSSQDHHHSQVGRHPQLLNNNSSTESALSLLSSPPTNNNYYPISDDLPARCSAALRDLIAENRASVLAHRHGLGPRGHVTLDLMQDPASPFGLLSHKNPKQGNAQDCSELWRLPLGY